MSGTLDINNAPDADNDYCALQANTHIIAGRKTQTTGAAVGSTMKCTGDSNNVNSSYLRTASDGMTYLAHSRGTINDGMDAFLVFDATGFQVAYSGTKGSVPTSKQHYNLMDSSKCYTKEEVEALLDNSSSTTETVTLTSTGWSSSAP